MHILAIDAGSSSVKAAILDAATSHPVAPPAKVAYEIDYPGPDAAEIPARRLHDAVWEAVRQALAVKPAGIEIGGIGISCLMPALVLLDGADRPLSPIWLHLDRRSRPVARRVLAVPDEEFLHTIGNNPLPGGISALCYRQQIDDDPGLKSKVRHYLHANGWLAMLLTGERCFDRGNASFSGVWGTLTDREWSPRWCEWFGISPDWLPKVVSGDETLGGLRPEVAAEWGLKAGIPVKPGIADTSSSMLAAGMEVGDMLHSVGTTQVLAVLVDDPRPDPRRLTRMYGVGDRYVYVAHNPVGGSALHWIHQLCFRDQSDEQFYKHTLPDAVKRDTEVVLQPAFLGGDRLQIEPMRAAFRELTLGTHREDVLAALLEAMREGHRAAYAALELPQPPKRVILTGGGADLMRVLLPEYESMAIETIDEGAVRGVAKLFVH